MANHSPFDIFQEKGKHFDHINTVPTNAAAHVIIHKAATAVGTEVSGQTNLGDGVTVIHSVNPDNGYTTDFYKIDSSLT